MNTGELLSDETLTLFTGTNCYTEVYVTDQGLIQLHVEDAKRAADPIYTLEQAKQLMAALGRQIWAIENELEI